MSLFGALIGLAAAHVEQPVDRVWSDEDILFAVDDEAALSMMASAAVVDSPDFRAALRRVGAVEGCRAMHETIDARIGDDRDTLRNVIVTRIRADFPPASLEGPLLEGSLSMTRRAKVERALDKAPEIDLFRTAVITGTMERVARLPARAGDWRGPFASWDYEGHNASIWNSTCHLSALDDGAIVKARSAYDGFYRAKNKGGN